MQWSWTRRIAALVLGSALLLAAPAGATQLVLSTPSLIGFHTVRGSSAAARSDFGSKLKGNVLALVRHAGAQSSEQAGNGQLVRSDALLFASARDARRVLLAWRHARHARNVRVGQGGSIAVQRSHGAVIYEVAWREDDRLGLITLRAGRHVAHAARLAVQYARLADGSLRHPTPRTAWGRALAQIRPNGTFSRQAALDLFALAFGPLPGVHPPHGAASTISSGTLAIQAILPYRSQLTKAQRDAVGRFVPSAQSNKARTASLSIPGFTTDPGLQATANNFITAYEAKLGYALPLKVIAGKTTERETKSGGLIVQAFAMPLNALTGAGFGTKTECIIEVTPDGLASGSDKLGEDVAHEVFHCFEYALQGLTNWTTPPAWIEEALAEWAALTVDPIPYAAGGEWLTAYIRTEYLPLFERTYDAVGFWGDVQDATGSLWARIPDILRATDNESAFVLAGADTDRFLDLWGSSVVRASGASFAWQMLSPIQPPGFGALQPYIAGEIDGTGNVETPPYTTIVYVVRPGPSQELLHVVIQGHARLSTQYDYTDLQDSWFCMTSQPCECPKGTDGTVPPTRPLGTSSALALSGDPGTGTKGYIASASLDEFCHPTGKPKGGFGPFGCPSGCGNVQGDPHMDTIDGAPYDFQAAGEFTVVRSRTDGLEIQERQQPVGRVFKVHTDRLVSVVTAVAMRVGGATLEFDHSVPRSAMVVRLNKHTIRVRTGKVVRLRGGGALKNMRSAYGVAWPDGTQVRVFVAGGDGVSFLIQPAADRSGELTGLLGNFDHSPNNDFVSRGGREFRPVFAATPRALTSPIGYRAEYKQFGPSWRIKQSQSLFFYPRGESTRTFTIPGFPGRLYPLRVACRAPTDSGRAASVAERTSATRSCSTTACSTSPRRTAPRTRPERGKLRSSRRPPVRHCRRPAAPEWLHGSSSPTSSTRSPRRFRRSCHRCRFRRRLPTRYRRFRAGRELQRGCRRGQRGVPSHARDGMEQRGRPGVVPGRRWSPRHAVRWDPQHEPRRPARRHDPDPAKPGRVIRHTRPRVAALQRARESGRGRLRRRHPAVPDRAVRGPRGERRRLGRHADRPERRLARLCVGSSAAV